MKFLETKDMECLLTLDGKSRNSKGSAYDVGNQFLNLVSRSKSQSEFEIKLIKPPSFEALTPGEIEILKSSTAVAFLAVHIGLTSYEDLGIEE